MKIQIYQRKLRRKVLEIILCVAMITMIVRKCIFLPITRHKNFHIVHKKTLATVEPAFENIAFDKVCDIMMQ